MGLLVNDVIQIEFKSIRVDIHIRRPAKTAADRRKILAFQIDRKLLPFGREDHRADTGHIGISKLAGDAAYFKLFYSLPALFTAGPERELFGAGQDRKSVV